MQIEVYSDVVCPWCYIGERRLERALAARPELKAQLRWRPFQLRPEMPREGLPWPDFVRQKFGGQERAGPIFSRVTETGAPEGIQFNFDRITRAPNTLDAHRLILFAAERGVEWEIVRALFWAYFVDGRDVGDREVLATVASEVGLDADEVRSYLASDANTAEVELSQQQAAELGVEGVPFYVFDGRYAVSGAQPVEVFLRGLELASPVPTT